MAGVYTLAEQDRVFYWVDLSEYDLEGLGIASSAS